MLPSQVSARGRMMEPAQRSSLFSRGFNSPENVDDSALNCGGAWRQHEMNRGRCGVCGDPFDAIVRENEAGGKYANGIIANTYTTNDTSMLVVIDIQSFLKGYFEFRICPHNDALVPVQQECLDTHQLKIWDLVENVPKFRYYPRGVGLHRLRVELPQDMTCTQCVLQWKWHTGTNWGRCLDGMYKTGCGPQEEYFNCADIAIVPATGQEYSQMFPFAPTESTQYQNTGSEPTNQPWKSVSFVSHDSSRVINLDQSETVEPSVIEQIVPVDVNSQITALDTSLLPKANKDVVVLPFNGGSSETINNIDTSLIDAATVSQTSVDATSSEPMPALGLLNDGPATEGILYELNQSNDTSTIALDLQAQPKPTVASTMSASTRSSASTTKETMTRNFDIRTFTGITTPNMSESVNSTVSSVSGTTFNTSDFINETATQPLVSETPAAVTEAQAWASQTTESPVPLMVESVEPINVLIRHARAVVGPRGPPPPPPPAGTFPPEMVQDPTRSVSSQAQKNLVQQQFASGNTMAQASSSQAGNLGTEMMGVEALGETGRSSGLQKGPGLGAPFPASASPDPYGPVKPSAKAYNPGQAPGVSVPAIPVQQQAGGAIVAMDPGMAGMTGMDPAADMGVPYEPPRIPPPPEVSAAEIERAIAETPIISSPVSDTGKHMDASSILGTNYIPGLNEAASNLAETSTASKQGTMIVRAELSSPADRAKKGGSVEYLSPTKGTSIADKPSETMAQKPVAKYSPSLGFIPTPEQMMAGMMGVVRPVPADTTNLEPTGPAPPDPNAQSTQEAKEALIRKLGLAMGILPGTPDQAVPANLPTEAAQMVPDPSIATVLAMADRQTSAGPLGMSAQAMSAQAMSPQAMSPQAMSAQAMSAQAMSAQAMSAQAMSPQAMSAQAMSPQAMSAQAMSAQAMSPQAMSAQAMAANARSAQAMAAQAMSREAMAAGQMTPQEVPMVSSQSQSLSEQAMFSQSGNQAGLKEVSGALDKPTGLTGTFTPEMIQALVKAGVLKTSVGLEKTMQGLRNGGMTRGSSRVVSVDSAKRMMQNNPDTRVSMGLDMAVPGAEPSSGRIPFGQVVPNRQGTGSRLVMSGSKATSRQVPIAPDMAAQRNIGPDMVIPGSKPSSGRAPIGPDMVAPRNIGPDMVMPGSKPTSGRINVGQNMVDPGRGRGLDSLTPMGTDTTPLGSVGMIKTQTMRQTQQGISSKDPVAPTNNIIDKSAEKSPPEAKVLMDKTMLQQMMKMRLSPEMLNWIQNGGPAPDAVKLEAKPILHNNLIKRNTPALPIQQRGMTSMTGTISSSGDQPNMISEKTIKQDSSVGSVNVQSQFGFNQDRMTGGVKEQIATPQLRSNVPAGNGLSSKVSAMSGQSITAQENINQNPSTSAAPGANAKGKQSDFMMNMGKLFGGSTGELGGRIMGGANTGDMSWVKYENTKQRTGQVGVSEGTAQATSDRQTALPDTSAQKSNSGTSSTSSTATSDGAVQLSSIFSGLGNNMGMFGLSGMGQAPGENMVMSEIVTGSSGGATSSQQVVGAQDGAPAMAVISMPDTSPSVAPMTETASLTSVTAEKAQPASDTLTDPGFTPIGGLGAGTQPTWALADQGASVVMQREQQWQWDPSQQAWIIVDVNPDAAQSTSTVVQDPMNMMMSQTSGSAQETTVSGSTSGSLQATDKPQLQGPAALESSTTSQADRYWAEAGFQWDPSIGTYVPIKQQGMAVPALTNVQATVSSSGTAASNVDVGMVSQQVVESSKGQVNIPQQAADAPQVQLTSQSQVDSSAQAQLTDKQDQLWEQAGYVWDPSTNAYIPNPALQQTMLGTPQVTGVTGTMFSSGTETTTTLTSSQGLDNAMTGGRKIGGTASVQVSSVDSSPSQPKQQQPKVQVQPTIYDPPSPQNAISNADLRQQKPSQLGLDKSQRTGVTVDGQGTDMQGVVMQGAAMKGMNVQNTAKFGMNIQGADTSMQGIDMQGAGMQRQGVVGQGMNVQETAAQAMQSRDQAVITQKSQQPDKTQVVTDLKANAASSQASGQQSQASMQPSVAQTAAAFQQSGQTTVQIQGSGLNQIAEKPKPVRGPLMVETQQWEQQTGVQQQQPTQQQQTDMAVASQAAQQFGEFTGQSSQMKQQSQQVDVSGTQQAIPQEQQAVQSATQLAHQQWGQTEQAVNGAGTSQIQKPVQQEEQVAVGIGMASSGTGSNQLTQQQASSTATASSSASASLTSDSAAAAQQPVQAQVSQTAAQQPVQAQGSQTASQYDASFTPVGAVGSITDATAIAWQAVLAAAQAEAQKAPISAAAPAAAPAAASMGVPALPMTPVAPAQTGAQATISWEQIVKAATAQQQAPAAVQQQIQTQIVPLQQPMKPQVPAWAAGFQMGQGMMPPAPHTPKPTPPPAPQKPKAPIRPDPVTRAFVRDMFIKQMRPGADVDPLNILIGLTPELLMKSGVNPRIAKSGDASQIIPAVERALGISLRRRRGRARPSRRRESIGGVFADPMGDMGGPPGMGPDPMGPDAAGPRGRRPMGRRRGPRPSARERALQRRKFMMEQRMINEVMQMLGLAPEPLEPGDPGYKPPRGGVGAAGASPMIEPADAGQGPAGAMGAGGMGAGGMGAGGMPGMGAGSGAMNTQRMMLEALGF